MFNPVKLSSEERLRHTERFDWVVKSAMAAIAILERTRNVDQEVTDYFKDRVGRLFSPNIRDGVVSIDKAHTNTDDIPLVINRHPEEYRMDESFLRILPSQAKSLFELYRANQDRLALNALQAMITPKPGTFTVDSKGFQRGSATYRIYKQYNEDRSINFLCRPLIQINLAHKQTTYASTASILFHEFVHADQYQQSPIINIDEYHTQDQQLLRELEAYDKQYK